MTEILKKRVISEQVRLLYRGSIRSVSMNYVAMIMIAILVYDEISTRELLSGLFAVFVITTVRLLLAVRGAPYKKFFENSSAKLRNFIIGVAMQGLAWGSSLVWFQFHLPIIHESIMLFLVVIAIGVTMIAYSTSRLAFFVFLATTTTPLITVLAMQGERLHFMLGFFMISGCIILSVAFLWNYSRIRRGIILRFGSISLMDSLKQTNKNLEISNERLVQLQNELKSVSLTDELTGVANRRHFNEHLESEWRRALRHKTHISLCMIDIDYFKKFNDHYGHQAGDECLKTVAQSINSAVRRPADMVARYGGEEFAVILPDTPLEVAVSLANVFMKNILSRQIRHEKSPFNMITVSVGISGQIPENDMDPENLIKMADEALYRAKGEGRNRIVVH